MEKAFEAIVPAPFGAIGIRAQDDYLVGVELIPEPIPEKLPAEPFVQQIANQVREYLSNPAASLRIPYAVKGTHFQKRVWQAIVSIPSGQTLSYSQLAQKVGSGPRAVANVCGANQVPLFIPCHRVVSKNGIGGFMQGNEHGLKVKRWLLAHEMGHEHF
ncbi:MAG TPA: methylated-DNA--[protein]-cysteine S-methyltransferase [Methylophilaceae bacterium]|nr:methylated-DNA--[protein]-cysteine S-methyltransferase [Methylophilaceae bacterium]